MKKLILLMVLGLLVVSCGKPSSASVVETSPTEKIEEPTPTPVPPTPIQELFSSSRAKFVGLPPDEARQLREQCLQENPDSLCLLFPVDPNGARAYIEEVIHWSHLVIQGPAGLEIFVPCDGVVSWLWYADEDLWCPKISCGLTREEWEAKNHPEYWPPETKMDEPEFWRRRPEVDPYVHKSNCFTEKEFESFVKARGGKERYSERFNNVEVRLGEVLLTLKTVEKPGTQKGQIILHVTIREPREDYRGETRLAGDSYYITEADFLHDSEGRVVYVKP